MACPLARLHETSAATVLNIVEFIKGGFIGGSAGNFLSLSMTHGLQQITVNTIFKITVIFVAGNVVLFAYYSCNFFFALAGF